MNVEADYWFDHLFGFEGEDKLHLLFGMKVSKIPLFVRAIHIMLRIK